MPCFGHKTFFTYLFCCLVTLSIIFVQYNLLTNAFQKSFSFSPHAYNNTYLQHFQFFHAMQQRRGQIWLLFTPKNNFIILFYWIEEKCNNKFFMLKYLYHSLVSNYFLVQDILTSHGFIVRDKVFKSRLSKFFKGWLPQNLLSPLLNTLCHIIFL